MSIILVPANFKTEEIKEYDKLNKRYKDGGLYVKEFYGSLNPSEFGCTKNPKNLPVVDLEKLKEYNEELKKYDFEFNYILNFLCYSGNEFNKKGIEKIVNFVKQLKNIGINKFTVANPVIANILGNIFDDIKISISVVNNVNTSLKVNTMANLKNVERMYISEDLIRDFDAIKLLKEEADNCNIELSTLLNSFCLIECPYKTAHANVDGHLIDNKTQDIPHYFYSWCSLQKLKSPTEIMRLQWIRPEDIKLYEEAGITNFKIAGRELTNCNFLMACECYMERHYDGNLMDLLTVFSENFFNEIYNIDGIKLDGRLEKIKEYHIRCRDFSNCKNCNICRQFDSAISVNKEKLNYYRNMFQSSYDNFYKKINDIKENNDV